MISSHITPENPIQIIEKQLVRISSESQLSMLKFVNNTIFCRMNAPAQINAPRLLILPGHISETIELI